MGPADDLSYLLVLCEPLAKVNFIGTLMEILLRYYLFRLFRKHRYRTAISFLFRDVPKTAAVHTALVSRIHEMRTASDMTVLRKKWKCLLFLCLLCSAWKITSADPQPRRCRLVIPVGEGCVSPRQGRYAKFCFGSDGDVESWGTWVSWFLCCIWRTAGATLSLTKLHFHGTAPSQSIPVFEPRMTKYFFQFSISHRNKYM